MLNLLSFAKVICYAQDSIDKKILFMQYSSLESAMLSTANQTIGRIFPEEDNGWNDFEEDRMRIINSKAFRRLEAKTQAFAHDKGAHFRKRLTHTLEVAAVARKIALQLQLNIPLTETIALAHDIGHPPFGHMGEDCLNEIMRKYDLDFYHNVHGFKNITKLERCFINFEGLNLTWESLEGVLKHNGPILPTDNLNAIDYVLKYNQGNDPKFDLLLDKHASLEAQVAAISDDIAYIAHDIEDAFRAGILSFEIIRTLPIFRQVFAMTDLSNHNTEVTHYDIQLLEVKRRVVTLLIQDVLKNTLHNLQKYNICDLHAVRCAPINLVSFSDNIARDVGDIKSHLMNYVYNFQSDVNAHDWISKVITSTFDYFMTHPDKMPYTWQSCYFAAINSKQQAAIVCDFVAGMTDSFILDFVKESTI